MKLFFAKNRRAGFTGAILAALVVVPMLAFAGSHGAIIEERKQAMKTVGGSMKTLAQMAKGEKAFEDFAAIEALEAMLTASDGFEAKFPKGSETGGETTAAAAIFSDTTGFAGAVEKFRSDVQSVIDAGIADKGALGAAMGKIGGNCKSCHESYRVKK